MAEQAPPSEAPPEPPPEQPETLPEAPPEQPPEQPEGDPAHKARREAADLRAKLKAEREGREAAIGEATRELTDRITDLEGQIAERDAQLSAVGKLRNPADVTRFIDVAATPPEQMAEAIAALLKERPYLGVVDERAVPQGAQANGREPSTQSASNWLRDAIIAKGGG